MEITINISFGLKLNLLYLFSYEKEMLMNYLNIIISFVLMICVWCEEALLRVCLVTTSTQLEIGGLMESVVSQKCARVRFPIPRQNYTF